MICNLLVFIPDLLRIIMTFTVGFCIQIVAIKKKKKKKNPTKFNFTETSGLCLWSSDLDSDQPC